MSELVKRLQVLIDNTLVNGRCTTDTRLEPLKTIVEVKAFILELEAENKKLKEVLNLAEKSDDHHINCPNCEGYGQAEQCGECFPYADEARLARWAVLGINTAKVLKFPNAAALGEKP